MHMSVVPEASFLEGIPREGKDYSSLLVVPCDVFLPL